MELNLEQIEYLLKSRKFTTEMSKDLEKIIRENIDPKYNLCYRCPAQIVHAKNILRIWMESRVVTNDGVKPDLEVKVDEVEIKKPCNTCKSKTNVNKK